MSIRKKKRDREMTPSQPYTKTTLVTQIVMTVFALLFLAPLFIIVNYSFKTKKELYLGSPLSLPQSLNLENYKKAFDKLDLQTTFFNTFFYTAVSVLILALLYGFSVKRAVPPPKH